MNDDSSDEKVRQRQFSVTDGSNPITVSEYRTKRGKRAEIATDLDGIRVDALILESLSWQRSREDLAAVLDDGALVRTDETPLSGGDPIEDSPTIQISNEYTQVILEHVRTATGQALQVRTPTRVSETNFGVSSLRALASHDDTFAFSTFFETPVGPEDTRIEGPH